MKKLFLLVVTVLVTAGALGISSAAVADAALTCSASVPQKTQARGDCSGSGTWRLKAACLVEPDRYTDWVKQTSGDVTRYRECTFAVQSAFVEISS